MEQTGRASGGKKLKITSSQSQLVFSFLQRAATLLHPHVAHSPFQLTIVSHPSRLFVSASSSIKPSPLGQLCALGVLKSSGAGMFLSTSAAQFCLDKWSLPFVVELSIKLSTDLCPGWDIKPDPADPLLSPSRAEPDVGDRELLKGAQPDWGSCQPVSQLL